MKTKFIIAWNFPNCTNYWNPEKCADEGCCSENKPAIWKNYYSTLFEDSTASAEYSLIHWDRLFEDTLRFKKALFSSTLPVEALDAISANLSTLKTPTCLRLQDGSFYGFEGCLCSTGCCEGSCTHVWNYAYVLPFLFPKLERSMRDLDFKYNQREDGGMNFRLQLPLGRKTSWFRACADGQFGGIIKSYRDWKVSGDTQWLQANWPAIKKCLEFAWAPTNEDKWDPDKKGVLEGRQHHTLDMELLGPNSWLTGMYLAALKAGAEMAVFLGEQDQADIYLDLFVKGKKWVDKNLFNGEYYQQKIDLANKAVFAGLSEGRTLHGLSTAKAYWNEESGELNFQIGDGCLVDQVLAQWHANLCGLGEIFDSGQVRKALMAIYRYNFKKTLRKSYNPCRIFSLDDEAGVRICEWPEGKHKPLIPITYAEETMNGFEYQAAAHMIQEGLVQEGMEIVRAVRERYDGEKRNPWNEFECGSNYARSMASYSLLNAFSGFSYDLTGGAIGFNPVRAGEKTVRYFWSLGTGWGIFKKTAGRVTLTVLYGELEIRILRFPFTAGKKQVRSVKAEGHEAGFTCTESSLVFTTPIRLAADQSLIIEIEQVPAENCMLSYD